MPVTCHRLRVRDWDRLPGVPDVDVVEAHGAPLVGAVESLCRVCRGHGGLGASVSPAGLAASCRSNQGSGVTGWTVTGGHGGPLGAIALAGRPVNATTRWSIPFLLVAPATRRKGIGLTLVRAALAAADSRGAPWVFAETLSTWEAASGFWRAVVRRLED